MPALTTAQIEALRQLQELWKGVEFCVIGATALQLQLPLPRQTNDVDISLAVDVRDYPKGLDTLRGWRADPAFEPRWFSAKGVKVDVIPSGGKGQTLTWPKTGMTMNLAGLRLAVANKILIRVGGIDVPVATVPTIAVLKMSAFLDRPDARERDLEDLAFLLERYVPDDDDRRFSDAVLDAGILDESASAFLLGTDVAALVARGDEQVLVQRFVETCLGDAEQYAILSKMQRLGPATIRIGAEKARKRIAAFQRGFLLNMNGAPSA